MKCIRHQANSRPSRTSHAEFTRNRTRAIYDAAAKRTVAVSTRDTRPSCQLTAAINASGATFTPSRKTPAILDFRMRGTSGPLTATSRNAGRKIPTVATTAPRIPPRIKPMKVAVVNTGPGITWPTATASTSGASVNQPRCVTRSARRKVKSP